MKRSFVVIAVLAWLGWCGAPPVDADTPGASRVPVGSTGEPRIEVSAPGSVALGDPLTIDVDLVGVEGVAGFEVSAQFDTAHADFAGVSFGNAAASGGTGNAMTMIANDLARGVSFGAFSCDVAGCPTGSAEAAEQALHHAELRIAPEVGGRYTVAINSVKVVDLAGRPIAVAVPTESVQIDVGDAGGSPSEYPAPAPSL